MKAQQKAESHRLDGSGRRRRPCDRLRRTLPRTPALLTSGASSKRGASPRTPSQRARPQGRRHGTESGSRETCPHASEWPPPWPGCGRSSVSSVAPLPGAWATSRATDRATDAAERRSGRMRVAHGTGFQKLQAGEAVPLGPGRGSLLLRRPLLASPDQTTGLLAFFFSFWPQTA